MCGEEIDGFGNNPQPLTETGRCCDKCNHNVVMFRMIVTEKALRKAHPDYSDKKLAKLYEDLRLGVRQKCLMGEMI